ncbi:thiolase family protein [Streptomyces sp. TP-A0874]|uniref:thiolase family protein n=1 Tax=Streptomyces sp. TP-A0874 TaxID=549819 RepID=UPI000852BD5A|nr:thiolase family protein [Streptomyces sp. TP-A0874]
MAANVISASMIRFGRYPESSYAGLATAPARAAIRGSGLTPDQVERVYCGHSFGGMLVGQRVVKNLGVRGVPVVNVENACSGGATALHQAVKAIESGECESALVIGVDKLSQFGGGTLPLVAEDSEVKLGMVMPAMYAMRAQRFLHERGAKPEDLAAVAVKAHDHGAANPYAQYRERVTADQVLRSRPIADPLTLLQCCPTGDGAAAVVLVSERLRMLLDRPTARIAGSVLHSGSLTYGFRDMVRPTISSDSAADALAQAGIGPGEVDVVELHDAFTVAELIYYEALGLCDPGEAVDFLHRGDSTYGGQVVVNPSGGLLSKGHPVGASGVAQVVEAYWHLTDQAGARQVPGATWAMTHVTGGGISGLDHGSCAVHVLQRM